MRASVASATKVRVTNYELRRRRSRRGWRNARAKRQLRLLAQVGIALDESIRRISDQSNLYSASLDAETAGLIETLALRLLAQVGIALDESIRSMLVLLKPVLRVPLCSVVKEALKI